MLISEVSIRGYKSFGNNEQILKLNTNNGELILLMGKNGSGKSSILENFEFSLYGKVKSKTKKWSKLSSLPNRINNELSTKIKFISNNIEVEIERGMNPNILKLVENGILDDKAGKVSIDAKIEKLIGIDNETFKSFISMSINDFKNFMSLTTDEKQILLDKLFNLEVVNTLNSILKDINKNNKSRILLLDTEIRTLDESIISIKLSIERAKERAKERAIENTQHEIDNILLEISSRKDEYQLLKDKILKIREKDSILNSAIDVEKRQLINSQNDIRNIQKEIDLYDSGKCPTCSSDFNSEHFINMRSLLVEKIKTSNDILLEINSNISNIKDKQIKLKDISDSTTNSFNDISYLLKNYKIQLDKLNNKKVNDSSYVDVDTSEFENSISELDVKKLTGHNNIHECREKELYYKELNRVFGEDGAKKAVISSIIKPINHFLSENIKKMSLSFDVKLDETFTAEIKNLGNIVDHDTLSTGETKKINICILLAYLMLIRSKKTLNILFLDEVFSSIDVDGISSILDILKSFANEYNINIFVVHHAILQEEMFDRIIKIEKDIFTKIIE